MVNRIGSVELFVLVPYLFFSLVLWLAIFNPVKKNIVNGLNSIRRDANYQVTRCSSAMELLAEPQQDLTTILHKEAPTTIWVIISRVKTIGTM